MTTDEHDDTGEHEAPVADAVDEDGTEVDGEDGGDVDDARQPSWWHRDHPVFTPLTGFFTGLGTVVVVPGVYAAVLSSLFDTDTAESLFPFVALLLVVPLALLPFAHTRRFGRYMLIGMLMTAVVVVAVAALTLWVLVQLDG